MTVIMAATPQRIARVLPLLAAVSRKEPRPGRRKSRLPRTNISQAMRKNQPPATDIMEFQTRPMVEKGRSSSAKTLPAAETINDGHLVEFTRNGFQRGIKAEGDIPDLAGKDEQDGTELDAELAMRKDGHHGQHDSGQEAEHGDGLQDV